MRSQIGSRGLALLKQWESLRLQAYRDPVGIFTIGWGHVPSHEGEVIGPNEADRLLRDDLANPIGLFSRNDSLTDGQFDALVCFAYNVGGGAYQNSTLAHLIMEHRWYEVPGEMMRWQFAKGKRYRGLLARRLAEATLFCSDEFKE